MGVLVDGVGHFHGEAEGWGIFPGPQGLEALTSDPSGGGGPIPSMFHPRQLLTSSLSQEGGGIGEREERG